MPIVEAQWPTVWFDGPIAILPPRQPYISPGILVLSAEEDEP